MPEARSVSVFLRAFTSQYQAAMGKAKQTMSEFGSASQRTAANWKNLGTRTQTAGREISRVGTTLTRGITLPVAALGVGAVKTAIDFESAFTGVRKTIDATEAQYRKLEKGIQAMAERLPASVEEISAVAEAAGQLGVKRESILGFTEVMIGLGETTNLTADQAATSLARFANITGMSQKDFDRLGSTIVDLGNKGASTEAEITEMALRIAGAGKTVGLADTEILGFAESLSSVGIRADAGGSSISRVFITMANDVAKGGKALEAFADVAGESSADFKERFETDAAGATIKFIEGLARIKKEGGNVFKVLEDLGLNEIRVRDALLRASGATDLFAESQENAKKAWKDNNALAKESEKRYKTTASQLEIMKNKFRNILATFGKDLMPILKEAGEVLQDVVKWFGSLSEEQRKSIIKWSLIAAALGPVVRLFGGITTAIGTIIRGGGAAIGILSRMVGLGAASTAASAGGAAAGAGTAAGTAAAGGAAVGPMGATGASAIGALGPAAVAVIAGYAVDTYLDHQAREKAKGVISDFGAGTGLGGGGRIGDRSMEGVGAGLVTGGGGLQATVATLRSAEDFGVRLGRSLTTNASAAANFKAKLEEMIAATDDADEKARLLAMGTIVLNKSQKVAARLIGEERDRLAELNIELSNHQQKRVAALIASGNFAAALEVLSGAAKDGVRDARNLGKGFDDVGADAEEAALKAEHLKRSIDAIPSTKTVRITVYQDTVTQEVIRRTRETGNAKDPENLDPNISPTVKPVFQSYRGSGGGVVINVDARGSTMSPAQVESAVRKGIDASGMRQGRLERARTARVA